MHVQRVVSWSAQGLHTGRRAAAPRHTVTPGDPQTWYKISRIAAIQFMSRSSLSSRAMHMAKQGEAYLFGTTLRAAGRGFGDMGARSGAGAWGSPAASGSKTPTTRL